MLVKLGCVKDISAIQTIGTHVPRKSHFFNTQRKWKKRQLTWIKSERIVSVPEEEKNGNWFRKDMWEKEWGLNVIIKSAEPQKKY